LDISLENQAIVNQRELKDIITDVVPIEEPNIVNVQSFRKEVSNTLYTQQSRNEEKGYAWVSETETGHRKRTEDKTTTLPNNDNKVTPTHRDNKHSLED